MRLTPLAYERGLASRERYELMTEKRRQRDGLIEFIRNLSVKANAVNPGLASINDSQGLTGTPAEIQLLKDGCKLVSLVLRPQLTIKTLATVVPELADYLESIEPLRRDESIEAAEILIKYEGYIKREDLIAEKIRRLESIPLGDRFDYSSLNSLSTEARQKLERIRPATVGQASRIPGVSPADINILLLLSGR